MGDEEYPHHFKRELPGIGVDAEVTFLDREPDSLGDRTAKLALSRHQRLPHRSRAVVVFHGRCEQDAAARPGDASDPVEPIPEQRAQARQSARNGERGPEHGGLEALLAVLKGGELQVFLGSEVGEEAALGEAQPARERTDAQALQPDLAGEHQRVVKNQALRAFAFLHEAKNSTNVRFNTITFASALIIENQISYLLIKFLISNDYCYIF